MAASIVWLASYPKSGNTWLRAFLMYLFWNARTRRALNDISQMSTLDASIEWFTEAVGEERTSWSEEATAACRSAAQRQILKRFDSTCFVKTHSAFMPWHGHPMFDMRVTAGAIYIVRNPLDIVASYAAHSGKSVEHTVTAMNTRDFTWSGSQEQVPQLVGSWSQNVASWTSQPNPALLIMRYEDMLERTEDAFGSLIRFLHLNPPADRVKRALEFTSFDSLRKAEAEGGFLDRTDHQDSFFRGGKSGGWREELTPDQARRIVDSHREQMSRFGYVPEGM
jgi:Sulfotransferase domain